MIYFDNAATTLRKPDCVIQAVVEAMQSFGNSGRGVHGGALSASRIIYDARAALAQLFGAESPERIAFTANSTQALNTAIKGVLNPGDHVITTALEHNSVLRPLYELEDQGVELTILPADSQGNIRYEDFEQETLLPHDESKQKKPNLLNRFWGKKKQEKADINDQNTVPDKNDDQDQNGGI